MRHLHHVYKLFNANVSNYYTPEQQQQKKSREKEIKWLMTISFTKECPAAIFSMQKASHTI